MRKSLTKRFCLIAPLVILSLAIISCGTTKKIKYFEDIPDSGQLKTIPLAAYIEPKIQVDDILTIIVSTLDPAATQAINLGNVSVGGQSSAGSGAIAQPTISGYLVDKKGNVQISILGDVNVVGRTLEEADSVIQKKAAEFYKDPSVIVRYANFKITVAGEVAKPSVYVMPNQKVTILDALTMAGDLTIYGKRDNILLLRDNGDGSKTPYRINLTNSDIINKPYYFLRQNDYLYVEPTKGKAAANDLAQTRNIAFFSSVLTVVIVIISRIK